MKFADVLRKIDKDITDGVADIGARHGDVAMAMYGMQIARIKGILSAYLGSNPIENEGRWDDPPLFLHDAAQAVFTRDLARIIVKFISAGPEILGETKEQAVPPAVLLQQAEHELQTRGFVDFDFVAHGVNALVIKGVQKNGSKKALRLSTGYSKRLDSIALLQAEGYVFLPRYQSIEILPFADEIGPHHEAGCDPVTLNIWRQRTIYLQSLLHHEGKILWQDSKPENMGLFGGKPFICDPGLEDFYSSDAEIGGPQDNATLIRETINKGVATFQPDNQGIITTEFFAALATDNAQHVDRVVSLAQTRGWHAIHLPDTLGKQSFLVIVDPARQDDEGYVLAKAMRDHLTAFELGSTSKSALDRR